MFCKYLILYNRLLISYNVLKWVFVFLWKCVLFVILFLFGIFCIGICFKIIVKGISFNYEWIIIFKIKGGGFG